MAAAAAITPVAMPQAMPEAMPVSTWFFMCGPLSLNVFVLGLAWNLRVFQRHSMALDRVLDLRADELPTSAGLARFGLGLTALQLLLFGLEAWRRGPAFGTDEVRMELLLVLYCIVAGALVACPWDVLHRKFRFFVLRRLARCLWPFQNFSLALPPSPTPFVEVFVADGLTSLSKFCQDAAVAWMLLSLSFTHELDELRSSYVSKMKASPLPYCAASVPYIIRATQCLISFQRTTSPNDRFLHLLNTLKYGSSLLVISVGAYPQIVGHAGAAAARLDGNSFFLFCAVFNSLYSFLWDVIMDWGLGQPHLPRRVLGLRHQLLYRPRGVYYGAIALDFGLRILWVTKWWDWGHYGVNFKMLSMVAEVLRRCVWNCLRVEWQCIKLEILGSKKLSEDSLELEQSLEKMPLMDDDDQDDDPDDQGKTDQEGGGRASCDHRGHGDAAIKDRDGPTTSTPAAHHHRHKADKSSDHDHEPSASAPAPPTSAPEGIIIAPAAITVATFSRSSNEVTTVVQDRRSTIDGGRSGSGGSSTHHRRPLLSCDEFEMGLLSAMEEA